MSHAQTSTIQSALFGGSFDPVHRGHLAMVRMIREVIGLDRVVFIPAAVSPFKRGTIATAEQRLTMLQIALAEEAADWAEVSDFELRRPAPSYSWETACHFIQAFPQEKWSWILGADQWEQIDAWAEPEILRKSLRFLVAGRNHQEILNRRDWHYESISFDHPASSSAIRSDFPAHRDWMTPGVASYCEEQGLYHAADS